MSDHSLVVSLPDHLYDQLRKAAETAAQPVEKVLLKQLEESFVNTDPLSRLPLDEQTELAALKYLSDDSLWAIAREQMASAKQQRMQALMTRNSKGSITADEYDELSQLVEQGQRLMLRKAQAANVLMDRGYKVSANDMSTDVNE